MPAKTACVECRSVKIKCVRDDGAGCIRCRQYKLSCRVVPRRLGRQPGSKNRPKDAIIGRLQRVDTSDDEEHPGEDPSGTFNMLGVLARVANDQAPQDLSPPGADEPFDRVAFLAEFWQDATQLDPDPYGGVAILEEGLGELYKSDLGPIQHEEVVHSRFDQPRLDASPEFDVVACGVVTENELHSLCDVYWTRLQPVGRVLDPAIHTVAYLRSQSATLTTVVLMLAAQSLPVSEYANTLVHRLETHMEFLLAETDKQGLQSLELCQGLALLCLFIGGNQLNRTWGLTAKSIAMAVELRLDITPPPSWTLTPSIHHTADDKSLARNVQRLWMIVVDWDRACALIRGRRPMLRDPPGMDPGRLLQWCSEPEALISDSVTAAYPVLLCVALEIQSATARQLVRQGHSFDFSAHRAAVDKGFDAWRDTWFRRFGEKDQHRILFDIEGMRLILLMMPCEYGFLRGWRQSVMTAGREACLETAVSILTRALPIIAGNDPVLSIASIYTYRYYRIAYAGFTALRMLNIAPRTRNADVYLLSVVAALARRLIDARLHANLATITTVLGRRLLQAARQLATARLGRIDITIDGTQELLDLVCGVPDAEGSWSSLPLFDGLSQGLFGVLDPLVLSPEDLTIF